jgi:hypothetical protein
LICPQPGNATSVYQAAISVWHLGDDASYNNRDLAVPDQYFIPQLTFVNQVRT